MKKYFLLAVLFLGSISASSALAEEVTAPKKGVLVSNFASKKNLVLAEQVAAPKQEIKVEKVVMEKSPVLAEEVKVAPDQSLTALRQRMANNKSLTEANQSDLAVAMAGHFSPGVDLRAPENEKSMLYFEQVANDPNMKIGEKLALIKKFTPNAEPVDKSLDTSKAVEVAEVEPMKAVEKVEAVKAPNKEEKSWFGFLKK